MKKSLIIMVKRIKNETRYILSLFLIWRISLELIAWVSIYFIPKNNIYRTAWLLDINNYNFINIWYRWDSSHYNYIATNGYEWVNSAVFFPLYPLLMRVISYAIPFENSTIIAGLLISNFSLLLALFYFYKLVRIDYSEKIAQRSLLYLLIFPMSIFLVSIYTESLFLMLSIASFYYARKMNYKASAFFIFLACLSRLAGTFLLVAIFFEYLSQNKYKLQALKTKNAFFLYLSSLGLILYMIFLNVRFNNPLLFITAQSAWNRNFTPIWNVFFDSAIYIFTNLSMFFTLEYFNNLIKLSYFVIFFTAGIFIWKNIRKSYAIYIFISLIVPLLSGSMASINRYTLVLFPVFILFALMSQKKKYHIIISIFFIVFLIYHTVMFANLYWVG